MVAVAAYSFVVSYVPGLVLDRTVGLRASAEDEIDGVDLAMHAETAYDLAPVGAGGFARAGTRTATTTTKVGA